MGTRPAAFPGREGGQGRGAQKTYTVYDVQCVRIYIYILAYSTWYMYGICMVHGTYAYVYMWQRIKNIGLVTGLGSHFATKVCYRRGCSATNPSATSPLKTTVLYTEVRDRGLQRDKGL